MGVTPQLSWGQDNAKSFAGTRTFPGHLGMGESDMCSLREIVGGEGGYRLAAKDIDRSLRINTDAKAPSGAHQAADESVHGVVPAGEEEDNRELPRLAQRRDLEEPGEEVEGVDGGAKEALRGGGREAEDASPQGVPPVQVSAKEEAQDDENSGI